jgi:hypothetical protein
MHPSGHQNDQQEHAAIEWHDSDLIAITDQPPTLILDLRAIVHRSHGDPGTEAGSVWVQSAAVVLTNGRQNGPTPALPRTIADGQVWTDDNDYENVIHCPFTSNGPASLDLALSSGESLRIDADQLTITFTGEPEFLEDFVPEVIEDDDESFAGSE